MSTRFSLGIDLGTSNSAVATNDFESDQTAIVEITQILRPNQIGEKATLPSALYVPHPDEFPADSSAAALVEPRRVRRSWATLPATMARLIPDRLVTSAKSWLSNFHIDPKRAVLPWKSDIQEPKLSAFDCSRLYLRAPEGRLSLRGTHPGPCLGSVGRPDRAHRSGVLRRSRAESHRRGRRGRGPRKGRPARRAAGGILRVDRPGRQLRGEARSAPGDIVLVCDVGGGTADFSLIAISEKDGNLEVERISVGEHILLGGDNMDLALAYTLQAQLEAAGKSIDSWQFLALIHAASQAKMDLFSDDSLSKRPISVPSRGSSLLPRQSPRLWTERLSKQIVLDGFFPITKVTDLPAETRSSGLQEFGLPYASDPVVSKHLARFLTRSLMNVKASDALKALVGIAWRKPPTISSPPPCFSTAASSTRRRSASACWTCSLPGTKASRSASLKDFSPIWPWPKAPRSTGAIAQPAREFASRRARRDHTTSGWKPPCLPSPASSRPSRPFASFLRAWRKGVNC